jgi:hypothetical protein
VYEEFGGLHELELIDLSAHAGRTQLMDGVIGREGVAPFRATNRLSDTEKAKLMGGMTHQVYLWAPARA